MNGSDLKKICIVGGEFGEPYKDKALALDRILSKTYGFEVVINEATNIETIESFIDVAVEKGGISTIIFITSNCHLLAKEVVKKHKGIKVILISAYLDFLVDKNEGIFYIKRTEENHKTIANIVNAQ